MKKSVTISLTKIDSITSEGIEDLYRVFVEDKYSHDKSFGFNKVENSKGYITASLVKRTPTFIQYFDTSTRQLIDREIFLYSEIRFGMDPQYQLLEIYGPAKDASKVRTAIRRFFPKQTKIAPVDLSPNIVISKLHKSSAKFSVNNLTINNFQHTQGVIGRYTMRLSTSDLAISLINQYSRDVTQAHITVLTSPIREFELNVSYEGNLRIICDDSKFTEVFSYIKTILFTAESI